MYNDLLSRKVNWEYKALHGCYWMLYCLTTAYITVLLLPYGFSSAVIGIIVAVSNILAAAGQLTVGRFTDRRKSISWKRVLLWIGALQAILLTVLLILQRHALAAAVLFPGFTILMYCQMPLVNAAVFDYTSRGLKVNFGSARGTGSLAYAAVSFLAGQLISSMGESVLLYLNAIVLAGLLAVTACMPSLKEDTSEHAETEQTNADAAASSPSVGLYQFAVRYPDFMLVLCGSILCMAFHNIGHTYMIQIMEAAGGDSAAMGTAFSIEAIMELPVMFGFYKIIEKNSAERLMCIAGAAFALKALSYVLASSVTVLYLAQVLQMCSNAIFVPASVYYAEQKMRTQDRVTGQSYMTASISVGAVLGNLLGGLILDKAGLSPMLLSALLLAVAGAIIIAVGTKTNGLRRRNTNEN